MTRKLSSMRALRRIALTLLATVLLVAAAAAAAAAAPLLTVTSTSNTTVAPGSDLNDFISILNVGDAPTDGSELDLTVALPPHVTGVSVAPFPFSVPGDLTCTAADGVSSVAGASTVLCTGTPTIVPGTADDLILTVHADDTATGELTSSLQVSGGGAAPASTVDPTTVSTTPSAFGIDGFDSQLASDAQGDPFTQAGGRPYAITTAFNFNTTTNPQLVGTGFVPYNPYSGDLWPVEPAKDAVVDLPPGVIGDPSVVTQCSLLDLSHNSGPFGAPLCMPSSQVGTVLVRLNAGGRSGQSLPLPVFEMIPPPGVPARFGFNVAGVVVTLDASLRSNGDYGLSVAARNIPEGVAIAGNTVTFWGVPADPSHDPLRWCAQGIASPCSAGVAQKAFLRNSTFCPPAGTGLPTALHVDSWFDPAPFNADGSPDLTDSRWISTSRTTHLAPGYPADPGPGQSNWGAISGPTGCEKVPFDPTFDAKPVGQTRAGTPTPFQFDLQLPQHDDPSAIGEGDLRTAVVTLPDGVHVSPSSADGLSACTPAQIGLLGTNFPEPNRIRFNTNDPACPESSKIGSVEIDTPLLPTPLTGSVYLASPNDNAFGTLLSIYMVAQGSGITIKLPGKIATGPDGQITTTFDDAPQTPFTDLKLTFKGGPRAPLVLPDRCGTYTTDATLTSWSGKTVTSDSDFTVNEESDGTPCAGPTFNPTFDAGTINSVAGATSPFVMSFGRTDRDRRLGGIAADLPSGLLGPPADVVLCPDSAANAGTCEDVSKIGSVTVGAGAGTNPFWIQTGRVYLTTPYNGARYGLSIVVPAIAGPFNLGNVVVRSALNVDARTASLKVVSDPLPTVLDGIPLDVKDVRVLIDRPHFFRNPTSCAEKRIYATITSVDGVVAHTSQRFQATECASLPFSPQIAFTVGARHHTGAGASTPLTTTVRQGKGQANLRAVTVTLPMTLNARLGVLNRACMLAAYEAGHCGSAARVGSAVAVTPLLRDPLRGSVYFVRDPSSHRLLPDLMVALRGQVAIDLVGKVGVNPRTDQLTTSFDTIPDTAITKFSLRLVSGTNGPLGVISNLCSTKGRRATVSIGMRGQNGKVLNLTQHLRILGCPRK